MAGEEKLLVAGLIGLGVGVVVGAALAKNSPDRRAQFTHNLTTLLANHGMQLVASDVGRGPAGAVWVLTLLLANQHVMTLHAPVDQHPDPFALAASEDVARRVVQYVEANVAA